MAESDLLAATGELLAYLRGEAADMEIWAVVEGRRQEMFNERERTHMADVRLLYRHMIQAGALGAAVCLAGVLYLFRRCGFRAAAAAWGRGYLLALALTAAVFFALAALITRDFTSFWTNFHGVFFSNDLWLLNPDTDRMIVMFPEGFFFDMVGSILRLLAVCAGGAGILACWAVLGGLGRRGGKEVIGK
jgi:integral membrane protein (TIGR01906 family)